MEEKTAQLASRFGFICAIFAVALLAAAYFRPIHAAGEFPGDLTITESYSYSKRDDVKIGRIHAPRGVTRQTSIVMFAAACTRDASSHAVVDITLQWSSNEVLDWSSYTAVKKYTGSDAEAVRTIYLYANGGTDEGGGRNIFRVIDVRPCPEH